MSLPHLAPHGNTTVSHPVPTPAADLPFTDAQVEEFREQDRWLPVSGRGGLILFAGDSSAWLDL